MALPALPTVTLSPVTFFPQRYFLENLAVRADDSILITAVLQKELCWVPPAKRGAVVEPVLVHTVDHPVTGIAEVAPDVFIVKPQRGLHHPRISLGPNRLHRLDTWRAGIAGSHLHV